MEKVILNGHTWECYPNIEFGFVNYSTVMPQYCSHKNGDRDMDCYVQINLNPINIRASKRDEAYEKDSESAMDIKWADLQALVEHAKSVVALKQSKGFVQHANTNASVVLRNAPTSVRLY